jgi:hypothetical protein
VAAAMDIGEVELLDRTRPRSPGGPATSWPCPGCGERHSLASSWHVFVRNRLGPPLERWIRLCDSCTCAAAGVPATPGHSPTASETAVGEPWLRELAETTAILRAISSLGVS